MSDASLSDETRDKILDALAAGRKIEAIKLYREATGQGLAEAKGFIEQLSRELDQQPPEPGAEPASEAPEDKPGGCLGVVLLGLLALMGVLFVQ